MPFDAAKLAKLQAQAGSTRIGASLPVALLLCRSCISPVLCLCCRVGLFTLLTVAAFIFDPYRCDLRMTLSTI